jgi:hypothetical protein
VSISSGAITKSAANTASCSSAASAQALAALKTAQLGLQADPAATALLLRVSQLMAQKLAHPGGPLQQASHDPATLALDDLALLSELVIQAWHREGESLSRELNRERMLRLRGERALAQLLESCGGTLRPGEVGGLLGISEDAVRKRRERKLLLGVKRGKRTLYPFFQFDQDNQRVWPALEQILRLLDTDSGASQLRFLLTPDADLGGCPADLLCRPTPVSLEAITRKANQVGRHLAY